ncbi:GAF domain-containing protein [Dokdonella sp. MW10]|uniref:GAF domain-containing protein n=1 Tax=Dokdonella sp. MW10 TaxID=2992926 RepID=UPI003F7FABC5
MNNLPPDTRDPLHPLIVGFEMPPADAGSGLMSALFDIAPSRAWSTALAALRRDFAQLHGLDDVRLVGDHLVLSGPVATLRALPSYVRALVHRVSRRCMDERVTRLLSLDGQAAPVAGAAPEYAGVAREIEAVGRIAGLATLLEAVTRATGMRFAAIARVTDTRWTACAVYDLVDFGLQPGQDLVLETTICNEIRQHGHLVQFDDARTDARFATHRTPAMYGFASYISLPILRDDGSFFGTLCALDPEPSRLDDATMRTLEMFARAIGRELEAELARG